MVWNWTIRSETAYVRYDKHMVALQRLNGSGFEDLISPMRAQDTVYSVSEKCGKSRHFRGKTARG